MPSFLTTAGTAHHLEQIITRASAQLILVSPYLKVSTILLQRLQDADRRGVKTTLVYGKNELKAEERQKLAQLHHIESLFLENLHAKCYANEHTMVITSMNMYEFSEKKNREMGIVLSCDDEAYADAMAEIASIRAAAKVVSLGSSVIGDRSAPIQQTTLPGSAEPFGGRAPRSHTAGGLCIRCLRNIPRNAARPLCHSCYDIWAAFGNADYVERGCHHCGAPDNVSMARPLCYSCYQDAGGFRSGT